MYLQSPGTEILKLGPLTIRWYGLMIALGFLAATYAATKLSKRWEIDPEKIVNLALVCFLSGIIGARLYFVALSWPHYSSHLSEIFFSSTEGFSIRGLSIHGGIFGAILAGLIYCRREKLPFFRSCDIIASCLPLGQAIGRWGNFFNSEAFGRPVDASFPLKLFIPRNARPAQYERFEFFHPTFLYECVWDLGLFALLYFVIARRFPQYHGLTFFIYIGGYSLGRLIIESLRTDSIMVPGTMIPAPTAMSIALMAVSLMGAIFVLSKNRTPVQVKETEQTKDTVA